MLPNQRKLVAAQGATIAADPMVRQAINSIKSGQEPKNLIAARFPGLVRVKHQEAKMRHAAKYGFSNRPSEMYFKTLSE